jgi:hypothetical protein
MPDNGVAAAVVEGVCVVRGIVHDNNMMSYYGRGPVKQIKLDRLYLQSPAAEALEFELIRTDDGVSLGHSRNGVWTAAECLTVEERTASFSQRSVDFTRTPYPVTEWVADGYVHLTEYGHVGMRLSAFLDKDVVLRFEQTSKQMYNGAFPLAEYIYRVGGAGTLGPESVSVK